MPCIKPQNPQLPACIKLVIFDCDGVLVDSETLSYRIYAEEFAHEGFNKTPEKLMKLMSGFSLDDMLKTVASLRGSPLPPDFKKRLNAHVLTTFKTELQPTKGIVDLLTALKHHSIPVCIVSNGEADRVECALKSAGLSHFFDKQHRFNVRLVEHGKPAPDLLLYAAHALKINPSECLVIEDSGTGIKAAQAASMAVIGFLGASHAQNNGYKAKIKDAKPSILVNSTQELITTLFSQS
ncbi:TPA: hypothetical protein DDZ86_00500 [Candidatus Dependentiae bacterium]|nr:MAG: hypothetical protein UW09_C0002G0023 [candidate division TM6 bacterium GW2011_GWF2_43_87]HBL98108.1 hypothetical protein [Candidatus Dependentiae bacterium]